MGVPHWVLEEIEGKVTSSDVDILTSMEEWV